MDADVRAQELLWCAWQTGTRLTALPEDIRPRDDFAAMAVQDRLAELAGPSYGWKIGATTENARAYLGIDTLFAGRLLLALEMPDSRYADHVAAGKAQVMADAACSARFVMGREVLGWRELDLAAHPVIAYLDGAEFARGSGGVVFGDPRFALRWLAGELPRLGHRLRAGDFVTTGTTTTPVPITTGSHVLADFGDLGTVEARFAGGG
ncbi:hydratase [Amycolatopsis sp. H20-H5]|uniref:hydratase n=1 Tax=Amycolatopsis sp. H20-H5 TaxID=3046309 RepID=UPI002DBE0581|nr:hydratase [Amycolatopsis sp. H20-H5]MEC3977611.1 hydratase [Amycolatopsis sp. H20-H5]